MAEPENKNPQSIEETVDHPEHYNKGDIECIDVIEQLDLNFNLGNALKYIWRCESKGSKKEDLSKAVWYLNRELENIQPEIADAARDMLNVATHEQFWEEGL